jgi:hypothetical protein
MEYLLRRTHKQDEVDQADEADEAAAKTRRSASTLSMIRV